MARGELTPQEIEIRKIISKNINALLKKTNKKQIDLHHATGIPKSTLTGYIKGTSTPNPGNIQKISDFFNVKKSDIDPRFSSILISSNKKENSSLLEISSKLYNHLDLSSDKINIIDSDLFNTLKNDPESKKNRTKKIELMNLILNTFDVSEVPEAREELLFCLLELAKKYPK